METIVEILDPDDFELVFRNEGKLPIRPPDPVFLRYREKRMQGLGLFLSNMEDWWNLRQPLNQTMMRANAAFPYLDMQDPIGNEMVVNLKTILKESGNRYPMLMKDLNKWAMESVCAVVFDRRLGCMDPNLKNDSWQQQFIDSMHGAFESMLSLQINPKYMLYNAIGYVNKKQAYFDKCMDYITDTSLEMVRKCKEEYEANPDCDLSKRFLPQLLNIRNLTMDQKITVIFDMMLAGIDTTTYTTINNLFLISKNPEVQEKLHSEISLHCGSPADPVTPTMLSKMHYLKAVIKESHRLKPIVPTNGRSVARDVVIKGYRIPKGTLCLIEHEFASKSSDYIKDPLKFSPERWLRTKGQSREDREHPFLVIPFGFGPRMCIGRRFAEQEIYIALIKLVQNFKFEYEGDTMPLRGLGLDKFPVKLDFVVHER